MSAATTIAPALKEIPEQGRGLTEPPSTGPAQHMRALARANEVRLARAALKRQVASGERTAVGVVLECPWEAESMSVTELLCSQRRWGRARSRKLIVAAGLTETKRLGSLTERQRRILAAQLEVKSALPA
jgi:hypothetical protein